MSSERLTGVEAYRRMSVIRAFERTCLDLSVQQKIAGSVHLCLGQEAIPVGARAALAPADPVVATYRGHGWAIASGVPLDGLLGEICHRADGVNGGRGGSAYLTAPRYGFYGENSIVGAGVPVACGLAMQAGREGDSAVVVSIGDGAMNQGATHEGLVFAAARSLPLVVICENNGWSEMTPIDSMIRAPLTERVAGYGIDARVVDGCDAAAVQDAVREARAAAVNGSGPVFLECRTVRLSGHYNRDIQHYRPKADLERAEHDEPLARLRRSLVETGETSDEALDRLEADAQREIDNVVAAVEAMPAPDPDTAREHVVAGPRGVTRHRSPGGEATQLTYQRAVNLALSSELQDRPETVVYGEDVGQAGGIFGVSRKLQKEFGPERVFDTPISESAILGSAVGASLAGLRPIVEIMWADFLLVALDQLVNQAANVRYMSRGELHAPMVVRTQQGATPGSCAQHSQSVEALLTHVPGINVGLPATQHDAYVMLRAAAQDTDPCILIESRVLYQDEGPVWPDQPDEAIGGARWHRTGTDLAILTWGATLGQCLEAAEVLSGDGVEASVLDLRWLSPLDDDAIDEAVTSSGGTVLIVHEANVTAGFGAEVAARIRERHPEMGRASVTRLGAPDVRIPAAPNLQHALMPSVERIVEQARVVTKK
ncbi:transketolase [Actinobacteria bacterium YIM 96077]|uniref:dihydrolipoyllysine-residue succinyltransferase n=1 Tax=Phytoactinopolyspora halophila TaxID=1981511 RepID=A0A329QDK3_9ACTN|nr:alpha-ketoacid dehydrogenase subunit alpha/beta [Phytoactinopolyspora halophila]AYY13932.1 transketolase [Actinobacteria bacterium YIM 96077]RAW10061.1 transketolase [Phytoactinopolyspora halophila]